MNYPDLSQSQGILLDLGCGENKQKGFVGIDSRSVEGVDIVHDLEEFPWPLHDEICLTVVGSHIIEHIKPWLSIGFLNEVWRVLKLGSTAAFSTPYPGSQGYWQDPTHCNGWNEASWQYFDPRYPLWRIYKPKPFHIHKGYPVWQVTGNLEVILEKVSEEQAEKDQQALADNLKEAIGVGAVEEEEERPPDLGICVTDTVKMEDKPG